jgi:hypothetical protein
MTETTSHDPHPRRSGARLFMLLTGAVVSLAAVGLIGLGALALWGDGQKDDKGYLTTDGERFAAPTRALATENLDIDLDGAESIVNPSDFGEVQLKVTPQSDKPLFVGIARTDDVSAYLRDVSHTTVTDIDADPFVASYSTQAGERRPAAPAQKRIWAAAAQGAGSQTLKWDVEDGDWSVVVMNADASRGLEAEIAAGAKVPFLDELGWSALGAGTLLFAGALVLLIVGARPPRSRPGSPAAARGGALVAPSAG